MARQLTAKEREQVKALMRHAPRAGGGYWLMPTRASVALEREFTGSLKQARDRVEKMLAKQEEDADERQ
ncbi:MAG TPA: hypothetical protein VF764_04625 [Steroidobacteraceae bacterium]